MAHLKLQNRLHRFNSGRGLQSNCLIFHKNFIHFSGTSRCEPGQKDRGRADCAGCPWGVAAAKGVLRLCTTKPLPKWSKHHSRGWWTRARGEDWGPWGCARQSTELHPSAVVGFSQVNSSHRASNRRERPKANSASALAAHAARNMDWQSTTLRGPRLSLCTVQSR